VCLLKYVKVDYPFFAKNFLTEPLTDCIIRT
jgi:hypothetical protein